MRVWACLIALLLMLCVSAGTMAATYSITLSNWTGTYGDGDDYGEEIDFGVAFSTIDSVYIDWSGSVESGLDWDGADVYGCYWADFTTPADGIVASAYTGWLGLGGYQSFSRHSILEPAVDWGFLLDGKANLWTTFLADTTDYLPGFGPEGYLSSAVITVDGTPVVPEPTSVLALAGGIGALVAAFRRRRV